MKLSKYAKNSGVSYQTALRWFHQGSIPGAHQMPSGTIIVPDSVGEAPGVPASAVKAVLYARVSTRDQKPSLPGQLQSLRQYALGKGYQVIAEVSEIGSGMNSERPKLLALLARDDWDHLIVEYPDRLARYGRTYIELLVKQKNQHIDYVNVSELGDDQSLLPELMDILPSIFGRIYGKSAAQARTKRALEAAAQE